MLTIYKASAGSGKTYRLTYEYIKKLLGYKDSNGTYRLNTKGKEHHRAILAITFTNKATEEMKQRIVKELAHLAGVKIDEFKNDKGEYTKSSYINDLLALFNCTEEDLQKSADKALKELLFDFTFFNVSTIDAFFQTILRTFAREAELTGNYEVQIGDDFAIKSSLAQVLSDTAYDHDNPSLNGSQRIKVNYQREWIRNFIIEKFREGKSFDIYNTNSKNFGNLNKFIKGICNEDFKKHYKEIYNYLSDFQNITKFIKNISSKIKDIEQDIKINAQTIFQKLPTDVDPKAALGSRLATALNNLNNEIPKSLSLTIINANNNISNRYNKAYYYLADTDFDCIYLNCISQICSKYNTIKFYEHICKSLNDLGLLASVMDYIETFRQENNLILLSDTNDLLGSIIADDDVPFIYERLGMLLRHYLIDEFQDTSHSQWDNLKPLVKNSISESHDNLIIGDEKQSIYRFRGSDPELLGTEVQNDVSFNQGAIDIQGLQISQNTNWRSSVEVIQFNNTLFTAFANNKVDSDTENKISKRYTNVAQQIAAKHNNLNGYVKFQLFTKAAKDKAEEHKKLSLKLLGNEIDRQLGDGYNLSDIAILINANKEGEEIIDYLLTQHQFKNLGKDKVLNISSEEALKISRSPAVKIIISILRQLDCPDGNVDSPYYVTQQRIETLIKDFEHNRYHLGDASKALLAAIENPSSTDDSIKDKISKMDCATLPAIIDLTIPTLSEDTRKSQNIYISAFMDEVIEFCNTTNGDLHAFLHWWDLRGQDIGISMPDNFNAIKIMTIHKSKGLEFPCVHIPFAKWKLERNDELLWYDTTDVFPGVENVPPYIPLKGNALFKETKFCDQYNKSCLAAYLDSLNKTYVAFTRAVKELFIISQQSTTAGNTHIGRAIKSSIDIADEAFCQTHKAQLGHKSSPDRRDIFAPLKNYSKSCDDDTFEVIFEFGKPTKKEKKKHSVETKSENDQYIPSAGDVYYTVEHTDAGTLSKVDDLCDIFDPRQRGIIMHNILAHVRTKEDLPLAVKRQAYRSLVPKEEAEKIEAELLQEITRDDTRQWFENTLRVINERTIVLANGKRHRCDRIVWTAEGHIDIIDYKTGNPNQKQINEYITQVRNYAQYMRKSGYENLRGFLWYLDSGKIESVDIS